MKSPELAPVKVKGVRPVKFKTAVPLLVTVTFLPVAEVVPTACRAKAGRVVGETEAPGMPTTPVPLRSMARDSGTVSEMVRMADSAAVTDGVNLTSTVQVALEAKVAAQWLVKEKSTALVPVICGALRVMVAAPMFFTVMV